MSTNSHYDFVIQDGHLYQWIGSNPRMELPDGAVQDLTPPHKWHDIFNRWETFALGVVASPFIGKAILFAWEAIA